MSTFDELQASWSAKTSRAGMYEWGVYAPSTAADTYPERVPVGVMVPTDGDYELELFNADATTSNVTVTLVASVPYEIANLVRVRSGAAAVTLLYVKA